MFNYSKIVQFYMVELINWAAKTLVNKVELNHKVYLLWYILHIIFKVFIDFKEILNLFFMRVGWELQGI